MKGKREGNLGSFSKSENEDMGCFSKCFEQYTFYTPRIFLRGFLVS